MNDSQIEIMVVAGEPSGDGLGAKLVEEIRRIDPSINFFGAAGPRMRAAGVDSVADSDTWPVTGVAAVLLSVPEFIGRMRQLESIASARNPAVVILIDFPEFNLKLAKRLHEQGRKVVYYVSPQLWAWRKYRVHTIKKYVDLLLSILPFEKKWYAERGVDSVEYVGNPIAENIHPTLSKAEFFKMHRLDQKRPLIALLPGSRKKEIHYNLPVMQDAVRLMYETDPTIQFVLAAASDANADLISKLMDLSDLPQKDRLRVIKLATHDLLNAADAAAVSSGTATLEAGVIGTPMAIVYKMSKLDAMILGPMVSVDHIGLINLVAGKRIMAEFVQDDFTGKALSDELFRLLEPATNRACREQLKVATASLNSGASAKAAELIVQLT